MDISGPPKGSESRAYEVEVEYVPKVRLKFPENAKVLHPYQERFVFWTPAPLYLWGGLTDVVWSDLRQAMNREVPFYHYRFQFPMFRGLETRNGDPAWNSVLWATEREDWDFLVDHLCSITVTNASAKTVIKYALQAINVADPLFMENVVSDPMVPLLTVYSFGVKSNQAVVAFDLEDYHPVFRPARLRFYRPDETCRMYAEALFERKADLCRVLEEKEQASGDTIGISSGDGGGTDSCGRQADSRS